MKKHRKILAMLVLLFALFAIFATPVYAISEEDVQNQVDSSSREAVAGNIFIWFLCAIAFLKVSQKIDSFMSSLGINVGHTGGSMLAEAALTARTITSAGRGGGFGGFGRRAGGSMGGTSGAAGFLSGGLSGVASRQFSKGAVQNVTGQGNGGIGGKMFASSMAKGGDFANNVIGSVAKGNMASTGSITGATAASALTSYMGITESADSPSFSDVEIGGGRITGSETSPSNPNGIEFGMYSADQYTAPEGSHSTVKAVDGSKWYKQYSGNAVEKNPYMGADGSIAYTESIVQRLPSAPRRKDRI